MTAPGGVDVAGTGRALAGRIVRLAAAARRVEAFVPMPAPGAAPGSVPVAADGPPPTGLLSAESCRALVTRALHAASAPLADRMLQRLAAGPATSGELAAVTGQPTLAVWETVSDLVQVGLAERDLERNQVRLTPAGRGVLEIVAALAGAATEEAEP